MFAAPKKNALALLVLFLFLAVFDFAIFFVVLEKYTARLEDHERNSLAFLQAVDGLTKVFLDASTALSGYSITKSPLFRDRFDKVVRDIPSKLDELKGMANDNENRQEILDRLTKSTENSLKILAEAQSAIDQKEPDLAQFHARHTYKETRAMSESLQNDLKELIVEDKDKKWLIPAKQACISEAMIVILLNFTLIWAFYMWAGAIRLGNAAVPPAKSDA